MQLKYLWPRNSAFVNANIVCRSAIRRAFGALIWVAVTAVVVGLVLGILYGESLR